MPHNILSDTSASELKKNPMATVKADEARRYLMIIKDWQHGRNI